MKIRRQIAYKVSIKDLLEGRYEKKEGLEPNYIVVGNKNVSRVNIMAVFIDKNDEGAIIDDGTGQIILRDLQNLGLLTNMEIGDAATIIGKGREFGNRKYIIPEIVRKVETTAWIEYRKKELSLSPKHEDIDEPIVEEEIGENIVTKVFNLIKQLDTGDGADYENIVKMAKHDSAENIIKGLIEDGEIFEPRPGKLKIL